MAAYGYGLGRVQNLFREFERKSGIEIKNTARALASTSMSRATAARA